MLLVTTYVTNSTIHGQGIFTSQFIPKGSVIWKFNEATDLTFTPSAISGLINVFGTEFYTTFMNFAYLDIATNLYILHLDNLRYMNHSKTPNTETLEDGLTMIALVDIPAFTELTEDYDKQYFQIACADFMKN